MIERAASEETGDRTRPVATGSRVLLVDDEPMVLDVLGRTLTRAGLKVIAAANGKLALEALAQNAFDAVVSDIAMPELDGVALLRAVRARDPDVPVLLMTGRPDMKTAVEAVELGALQYLIKPFDKDALVHAVSRAVALSRLARVKREAIEYLDGGSELAGDRTGLEIALDRTLGSAWMAFQPIVDVRAGKLFGYEALVRTSLADLQAVALLRAAERLGRIGELGRKLRELTASAIDAEADDSLVYFVNVHGRELAEPSIFSPSAPLSRHANRVVLELTERTSLDDVPNLESAVAQLRELGYRIAIDDLGAGYAGLTSFAKLQPDVVKIDMSLVRDIHNEPMKRRLVRAMTSVCRDLGIAVVVEGVESPSERDALLELGCTLMQGFLFARPARPPPKPTL